MNLLNSGLVFPSKWLLFIPGSALLLLILVLVAGESILLAIANFLVVKDDHLQPADMIHVLGGSFDRVDYGVELYHRGYAARLFVTGCDYIAYKERAIASGVRPEDLLPDSSWSTTTYEEALELKGVLDSDESVQSVIVVSSPYHMRRAQWSFDKVLGDRVRMQFTPVPSEMTSYQKRWWTDARLRKLVVKEYLGNIFYYVRHNF
jgi:uncharacterized SAM-binding protein YcdF (DUF218 family)